MSTGTKHETSDSQTSPVSGWSPSTEQERAAVQEQLERILTSPYFRNSKKYPAFLRYIVEHTLNEHPDQLKERTLGVEVFARQPEYDTSVDPVVRIVAAEVRKRIGQYYHELAAPGELLLDLPSGTYVPKFGLPGRTAGPHPAGEPAALEAENSMHRGAEPKPAAKVAHRRQIWGLSLRVWSAVAAVALILTAVAFLWPARLRTTAMDQFWGPILNSPGGVLLVTGGDTSWMLRSDPQANPTPLSIGERESSDVVAFAEASTLADVAGVLRSFHEAYAIRPSTAIDLPQLRTGSAVLIGALSNPWALRLTGGLRFTFQRDQATGSKWIQDRKDPGMRNWQVTLTAPYMSVTEDWAVISRFRDPDTEHWILTASGLSRWGTGAAGEFLTNPLYLQELVQGAPGNWVSKNLQIVIATKVIHGQAGRPRIVATEFW